MLDDELPKTPSRGGKACLPALLLQFLAFWNLKLGAWLIIVPKDLWDNSDVRLEAKVPSRNTTSQPKDVCNGIKILHCDTKTTYQTKTAGPNKNVRCHMIITHPRTAVPFLIPQHHNTTMLRWYIRTLHHDLIQSCSDVMKLWRSHIRTVLYCSALWPANDSTVCSYATIWYQMVMRSFWAELGDVL